AAGRLHHAGSKHKFQCPRTARLPLIHPRGLQNKSGPRGEREPLGRCGEKSGYSCESDHDDRAELFPLVEPRCRSRDVIRPYAAGGSENRNCAGCRRLIWYAKKHSPVDRRPGAVNRKSAIALVNHSSRRTTRDSAKINRPTIAEAIRRIRLSGKGRENYTVVN